MLLLVWVNMIGVGLTKHKRGGSGEKEGAK